MKWDNFKKLTNELKEEYMFIFGKRPEPNFSSFMLLITNFVLIIFMVTMMYYMMIKDAAFAKVLLQVETMFFDVMKLSKYSLAFAVFYIMFMCGQVIAFFIIEYIWVRKNIKNK